MKRAIAKVKQHPRVWKGTLVLWFSKWPIMGAMGIAKYFGLA